MGLKNMAYVTSPFQNRCPVFIFKLIDFQYSLKILILFERGDNFELKYSFNSIIVAMVITINLRLNAVNQSKNKS